MAKYYPATLANYFQPFVIRHLLRKPLILVPLNANRWPNPCQRFRKAGSKVSIKVEG